jgi:SAM-dependent methyltransferase
MYSHWERHLADLNDQLAGGRPWRETLADRAQDLGLDEHTDLLFDEARGNWLWLVDTPHHDAALDVLGGVGSLSAALAHHYHVVHYLESRPEFMRFARERFRQDGLSGIQFVSGMPSALPFPENALDCITIHDLPSVLGTPSAGANLEGLRRVLSCVRRVLRPGGCLYLGVDLSPMGREAVPAGWLEQFSGARNLLRSQFLGRTLEREIRRAGFPKISCYYAEPSYWQPTCMIPADRGAVRFHEANRQSRFRRLRQATAAMGLHGFSFPSRILLAGE